MKKGEILEGIVERVAFPNKGIVRTSEGKEVIVKIRFLDRPYLFLSVRYAKEKEKAGC